MVIAVVEAELVQRPGGRERYPRLGVQGTLQPEGGVPHHLLPARLLHQVQVKLGRPCVTSILRLIVLVI